MKFGSRMGRDFSQGVMRIPEISHTHHLVPIVRVWKWNCQRREMTGYVCYCGVCSVASLRKEGVCKAFLTKNHKIVIDQKISHKKMSAMAAHPDHTIGGFLRFYRGIEQGHLVSLGAGARPPTLYMNYYYTCYQEHNTTTSSHNMFYQLPQKQS